MPGDTATKARTVNATVLRIRDLAFTRVSLDGVGAGTVSKEGPRSGDRPPLPHVWYTRHEIGTDFDPFVMG